MNRKFRYVEWSASVVTQRVTRPLCSSVHGYIQRCYRSLNINKVTYMLHIDIFISDFRFETVKKAAMDNTQPKGHQLYSPDIHHSSLICSIHAVVINSLWLKELIAYLVLESMWNWNDPHTATCSFLYTAVYSLINTQGSISDKEDIRKDHIVQSSFLTAYLRPFYCT